MSFIVGWVLQQVRLTSDELGPRSALVLFPAALDSMSVGGLSSNIRKAGWPAWIEDKHGGNLYGNSQDETIRNAKLFVLLRPQLTESGDTEPFTAKDLSTVLVSSLEIPSESAMAGWFACEKLSVADIEAGVTLTAETKWRQQVAVWHDCDVIEAEIKSRSHVCLLPPLVRCASSPFLQDALRALDQVAMDAMVDVAGRALACIAELLARAAQGKGGLRSGPARNSQWRKGLTMLEQGGNIGMAVKELAKQRTSWLGSPEGLIRAARHYEAAFQLLISRSVSTAFEGPDSTKVAAEARPCLPRGKWAVCEAPARIDLAGGWSDTPPIAYEYGGNHSCIVLFTSHPLLSSLLTILCLPRCCSKRCRLDRWNQAGWSCCETN